jgi:hypothetical protein
MKKIARMALSARVVAAVKRLCAQAPDLSSVDRYRPEKHYMRGPGPRTRAKGTAAKIRDEPELPAS